MKGSMVMAILISLNLWLEQACSQDVVLRQVDRLWGQAVLLPDSDEFKTAKLSFLVKAAELSDDNPINTMEILHTAAECALFSECMDSEQIDEIIRLIDGQDENHQISMQMNSTHGGVVRLCQTLLRESDASWNSILRITAKEDIDNLFFLLPGCRVSQRDEALQALLLYGKQDVSVLDVIKSTVCSSRNGFTNILLASKYAGMGEISYVLPLMESACQKPMFNVCEYLRGPGDTDLVVPPSRKAESVGLVGVVAKSGVYDSLGRTMRGLHQRERFSLEIEDKVLMSSLVHLDDRHRISQLMMLSWLRLHADDQATCRQFFVGWDLREAAGRFMEANGGIPCQLAECRNRMRRLTREHADLNNLLSSGGAEISRNGGNPSDVERKYRTEIIQKSGITYQVVNDYAMSLRVVIVRQ